MRKLYFILLLLTFSAGKIYSQCLNGVPYQIFTPACSGTQQTINTCTFAGEFNEINVVSGNLYVFSTLNATDFITISDETGTTAFASGTQSVSWTATLTGVVRYYIHLDPACGTDVSCHTVYVACYPPCSGTPNAGTAVATPPLACVGGMVNLTVTGSTLAAGLSYQWQSSPDNVTYTDIAGATSMNYAANVTASTWYRLVVSCGASSANSVPVQVTTTSSSIGGSYNVGVGQGASGGFETLTAAVTAWNNACTINSNVTFNLMDATYSTGETFPIVINSPLGGQGSNTLTIKPATGVNATITGSASSIIKINGADNVTIDGSNNNTDSRNLTIINNSTATSSGIWVASLGGAGNGANNVTVKNLKITGGSGTLSGIYGIVSAATGSMTTAAADNDNLTIQNNAISKVYNGISLLNTVAMDGLLVTRNEIGSTIAADYITNRGIEISVANNPVISYNSIFNIITPTSNTNTATGINIGSSVIGGSINGNDIRGVHQPNTGGWTAYGIRFEGSGTTNVTVSNNFISDVKTVNYSTTSTTWNAFGIGFNNGTNLKIYYNTIHMYGPVTGGSGAGMSANLMVSSSAVTGLDVRNNIFVNTQSFTVSGSFAYNIYLGPSTNPFTTINFNDYYGAASANTTYRVGYGGSAARTTLADWQGYTTQDGNSVSIEPVFVSPSDLHLIAGLNPALNGAATPIAAVTSDIDNDPRDPVNPDIGADEFNPPAGVELGTIALVTPIVKDCYTNAEGVSVRIRNFSGSTHDFSVSPTVVTVNVTGAATTSFTTTVNTGTLNSGAELVVNMPGTLDMSTIGSYDFSAYIAAPGDLNQSNDTLATVTRTLVAPVPGTVTSSQPEFCVSGTPTLTLAGNAGGDIQWQQAAASGGPWTNVGTGATSFTPSSAITTTTWYRVVISCNANSDSTAPVEVVVNSPQLLSTTPGSRCGPGTVVLGATGSAGADFNWYTSSTGGVPVFTGPNFTTPVINTTTTYYVSASSGGFSGNVGKVMPNGTDLYNTGTAYLIFDALTNFTINSIDLYPYGTGSGTATIALQNSAGTTLQSVTVPVTGATTPVVNVIPLNFNVTPGTGYRLTLVSFTGVTGFYRDYTAGTVNFPYTLPGVVSITNGSLAGYYYYFYNWSVSTGCESPRQAVTATVTPGPAFAVTQQNLTVCNDAVKELTVTTGASSFDSFEWTPVANLYTDAAATVPYTGGNAATVYHKTDVPGIYTYIATGLDNTTQCTGMDSVKVTVLPVLSVAGSPSQICVSGESTLSVSPSGGLGTATFQWYSSTDGTNFNIITNATGTSYTTPTLTQTTWYQVEVKDAAGTVCQTVTDTLLVDDPSIVSTTSNGICAASGTVDLMATASPGAVLNWYANPTGGTPLGTGTTFTTPTINTTTTFYVAAASAASSTDVGVDPTSTSCGAITTATASPLPLRFNTTGPVTINSAWVIPQVAGTFVVSLQLAQQGGDLQLATFNFLPAQVGIPQQINLGFTISTPGSYQLTNIAGIGHRIPTFTCSYPMTSGALAIVGSASSVTAATNTNTYNTFFLLNVTEACESPRVPVTAIVDAITNISQPPQSQAVCAGANVTFSVTATGANLTYQWLLNGQPISGATNSTYVVSGATPSNNGNYAVIVSGLCGTDTTAAATLSVSPSNAWLGAFSSDWNNGNNWCGGVPTSTTDVVIPSGTPHPPVIYGVANVRNITINSGAILTVTPSGAFSIYGDFTNNGMLSADNGFIFFKGSSNQNVSGLTTGTVVLNGTGGVTLAGNLNTQTLIMQNGNLTLGSNNVTLTGSVNGSLTSHIITNGTGSVISKTIGSTPVVIPVGPDASSYNPVTISNGQGRDFTVRVSTGINPAIANNNLAINRTWDILPSTAVSNVAITLQYADAHANSGFVHNAPVEAGLHNTFHWYLVSPAGGIVPFGTADGRQAIFTTSAFGPFVVASPGGIAIPTSVVTVNPDITGLVLMPNLVESNAILRITARRSMKINWNVVDAAGRIVMTFNSQINAGTTDIPLDLSRLKAGMYFIAGSTGTGKPDVVRFIKL